MGKKAVLTGWGLVVRFAVGAVCLVVVLTGLGCLFEVVVPPPLEIPLYFRAQPILEASATIDTSGEGYVLLADIDGDGDLDGVSGFDSDEAVILNGQVTFDQWVNSVIATGFGDVLSLAAVDLDRTPQLDVLAATDEGNVVVLLAPTFANSGGVWDASVLENPVAVSEWRDVKAADLNDQSPVEIVAASPTDDVIVLWYTSALVTSAGVYEPFVIAETPGFGYERLAVADLDEDGDLDIVAVGRTAGMIWLENPGAENILEPWRIRTITLRTGLTRVLAVNVDPQADADIDIVATDRAGGSVYWYENPGSPRLQGFAEHLLTVVSPSQPDALSAGDLNMDGELDLVVGTDEPDGSLYWMTAQSNVRELWSTALIVSTGFEVGEVPTGDIDDLGKVDIMTTLGGSVVPVVWLEQE